MNMADFAEVMDQYQATWPKTKLNPKTIEAWFPTMAEFSKIHAYQALERLAEEQDLMPMLSQFRRMAVIVRSELDDTPGEEKPKYDPADYPESAYLKAAKVLIYGDGGSFLLTTPVAELDTEGAGLKAKILDCGQRHGAWMEAGHKPDTNMLVEVSNLGAAIDEWWQPRKEDLEAKKQRDAEALETRRTQRKQPQETGKRRRRAS